MYPSDTIITVKTSRGPLNLHRVVIVGNILDCLCCLWMTFFSTLILILTFIQTSSSHTFTYSSLFASLSLPPPSLTVLWLCLFPPFPILLISFSHFSTSTSLSLSLSLSLSVSLSLSRSPLSVSLTASSNRAQQTVKTGERRRVVGVFVCVSSGVSAEGGQYN